ncbi:MAG: pyridoxamine 5'-phosphate oxidase family protein [Candidatus Thorarchaeota archaeon]|nr:pyridoxamine 5'-phosphate oxidase family protein [Candidatus Thorarchaeota archaeon]
MNEEEIRKFSLNLTETAWPAYLTSVDKAGFPQTRAMFNLRNRDRFPRLIDVFESHKEDFMILFTTNTSSKKVSDIHENRAVSVYYCDPITWQGAMFGGLIEIVEDSNVKESIWHPEWLKYYLTGHDDPDHTVLRLFPDRVKGWSGSQTFTLELR